MSHRVTKQSFVERSVRKHGVRYDYSEVEIVNASQKVCIICNIHGRFDQTPTNHMQGRGCPKCAIAADKISLEQFVEKASDVHKNFYSYDKIEQMIGLNHKYKISCPEHGDFIQRGADHLNGFGCNKCKGANLSKQKIKSKQQRLIQLKSIHPEYQFIIPNDTSVHDKIEAKCQKHGTFDVTIGNAIHRQSGCPACAKTISNAETELYDFIQSIYRGTIIRQDKQTIAPSQLDIGIPEQKLALEYNGMFWHSDIHTRIDRNYHQRKTIACNNIGYQLIHVSENDWINKKQIIKDIICKRLNVVEQIYYARKCKIIKLNSIEERKFFEENHIQGYSRGSIVCYGLIDHQNQLVSAMSFCKNRFGGIGQYELLRFANRLATSVVGGASKMFSKFVAEFDPKHIVTYCDATLFNGNLYNQLGFEFEKLTDPNYLYWSNKDQIALSRYQCQKHKLIKIIGDQYDPSLTEYQNMTNNHYYRVWNSGNYKFNWIR